MTWLRPVALAGREHISAEVQVLGVQAGVFELDVKRTCGASDPMVELRSRMSTVGLVRFFKATDGSSLTKMNLKSARPLESDLLILDGEVRRRYRAHHEPGMAKTTFLRTGEKAQYKTARIRSGEHPLDMQSAFLLLRYWKAAAGTRGYFYVLLGKNLWRVSVEHAGVQPVEHRDRMQSAIKLQGSAVRVEQPSKSEPRRFSIWLSNDSTRSPLRVEGDASFGKVNMELLSRRVESDFGCAASARGI